MLIRGQAASSVIKFFDKMIEVFRQMGRILPQFQRYTEIFDQNEQIRRVLSLFYGEILALYATLFKFLNHPGNLNLLAIFYELLLTWNIGRNLIIESFWPNVRSEITAIQENIADHEKVMTSHVTLEHVLRSHKERQRAIEEDERAEEARNRQYWKELRDECTPELYDTRYHDILAESLDDSGLWLDEGITFTNWLKSKAGSRCFWLNGMPGAGTSSQICCHISSFAGLTLKLQAKHS
jgi:hypothetical protein